MQNDSDANKLAALFEKASNGDRDSFIELFGLLYTELISVARKAKRRVGANTTTAGLLHEAYVKLESRGYRVPNEKAFRKLVYITVARLGTDGTRRGNRLVSDARVLDALVSPPVQEQHLEIDEALRSLHHLGDREFENWWRHDVEDLSHEAISAKTGASVSTVRRDVDRGRAGVQAYRNA